MKAVRLIGWVLLVGMLTGCSTVETPPADDAYYWDEPWSGSSSSSSSSEAKSATPTAVEPEQATSKPVIEYTNVSDTTVTVRIKR